MQRSMFKQRTAQFAKFPPMQKSINNDFRSERCNKRSIEFPDNRSIQCDDLIFAIFFDYMSLAFHKRMGK